MVNARFDPLGREVLTARQLASTFSILRAERIQDSLQAFERHDDLLCDRPYFFFDESDLPEAVIFVSHRWETETNPDPKGENFRALQSFLRAVGEIADWRRGLFPSQPIQEILRHGKYQAAYFLGSYNRFDPDREDSLPLVGEAGGALDKIGVWYDFTCMSQAQETLLARKFALARLHDLLGAANLVAFRKPGDAFDRRCWCAAELSTDPDIERSSVRKICLRLDKLGEPLDLGDLVNPNSPMAGMTELLKTQMDHAKTGNDIATAVANFQQIVGVEAEDDRETPLLFNRRAPNIFAAQKDFFLAIQYGLDQATREPQKTLDLENLVTEAAKHVELETSNPEDLAYTSLMILYARHRGAPDMARLYGEGLTRYLEGRTTRLAHFALLYDAAPDNSEWKIFRGRCEFSFAD
ncbi:MAG: hypothetical protein ABJQ71_13680 [Roseibium sp.]